jgi:preprotein translocase subunit SecA
MTVQFQFEAPPQFDPTSPLGELVEVHMDPTTGENEAGAASSYDNLPDGLSMEQREALPFASLPEGWDRTGRNAPCPCGSGKKFKHCHGALV